ncbi:MAG TPA: DUF362 domain-containing protein, partial [Bryobacteraceae bacterium]|nr:DUF362 domain-containing protein [Bryobacteraceae bacterium]
VWEWTASAAAMAAPSKQYFGLSQFIESNPKAVFIRRTKVPHKMDAAAKRAEGLKLAREIFVAMDKPGVPLSNRIIFKPNVTSVTNRGRKAEENWGTGTDPDFYEGILMGLKEIGLRKFYFLESNMFDKWNLRGFMDINFRHGVEMNDTEPRLSKLREIPQVVWSKVPEPVVYSSIPHFAPVNEPGTYLVNIAKWKAHSMCLTQTVKNEQGLVVNPYVRFCQGWSKVTGVPDLMKPDIAANVEERVKRYFANHQKNGFKRYGGDSRRVSPIAQEIWAHKTCDNMSVIKTGLAMVEGIYGRDGDGFNAGDDYLTNLVFFGKDKFRVDLVGLWLGGHEPGNVHLYRIAKERGLSDTFNPWDVPVFEWIDGKAVARKLSDFERTPLKSPYLRLPGEEEYHLVNEKFDYDRYKI